MTDHPLRGRPRRGAHSSRPGPSEDTRRAALRARPYALGVAVAVVLTGVGVVALPGSPPPALALGYAAVTVAVLLAARAVSRLGSGRSPW